MNSPKVAFELLSALGWGQSPPKVATPPLDMKQAESSQQHVRALNTHFASKLDKGLVMILGLACESLRSCFNYYDISNNISPKMKNLARNNRKNQNFQQFMSRQKLLK